MTTSSWSQIKRTLGKMPRSGLLALLKELLELSPDNRSFLAARFLSERDPSLIRSYRRRVVDPFYPRCGFGQLKFADARKAIREYEKATGDLKGVIDLMLSFVEAGTQFTKEFGDIDARFYDALESMLYEAIRRIKTPDGRLLYSGFEDRFRRIAQSAYGIAWGFGDNVNDAVAELEERMRQNNEQE